MKKILALLAFLCTSHLWATSYKPDSKVTEVTVYRQMAKETRVANINITEGVHEIIISGVSPYLDANTLQVSTKGGIILLSATTQINYLNNAKIDSRIESWRDSVNIIIEKLDWIAIQKLVYEGEVALISNNTKLGSTNEPMKVVDIPLLADTYRDRMMSVKEKIFEINKQQKKLNEKLINLNAQISANSSTAQPVTEIVLKVEASNSQNATVKCNYLVNQAGWYPIYEVRAKSNEKDIKWMYKANIRQATGYDWKDVKLTVSTGMPSQNNDRPILNPLYVNFYTQMYLQQNVGSYGYSKNIDKLQLMEKSNMAMDVARAPEGEEFKEGFDSDDIGVVASEGAVNMEYTIEKLQDINANNKDNMVAIEDYNIPAIFAYHSVPKRDKAAFLLAKLTGWNIYNLLPGSANIFFDDMYVGKTNINPQISADTMLVSLGRDENVVVKRTIMNEFCSTKLIGNTKKETKAIEIFIKNNKNQSINLEVLDQIPISQNKEIEVELEESSSTLR